MRKRVKRSKARRLTSLNIRDRMVPLLPSELTPTVRGRLRGIHPNIITETHPKLSPQPQARGLPTLSEVIDFAQQTPSFDIIRYLLDVGVVTSLKARP